MSKPRVITRCVANYHATPGERIIEFSSAAGGGLISFFVTKKGVLQVGVYGQDPTVRVLVAGARVVRRRKAKV